MPFGIYDLRKPGEVLVSVGVQVLRLSGSCGGGEC